MLKIDRFRLIMESLSQRQTMRTEEVLHLLDVSPATARRDFIEMEAAGLLCRQHGGITMPNVTSEQLRRIDSASFVESMVLNVENKRLIGARAVQMFSADTALIINAGSTCLYFAQQLLHLEQRVLTNSHIVFDTLVGKGLSDIYITSGRYYDRVKIILSPYEDYAGHFFGDVFVTSCSALGMMGAMENDPLLVQATRTLARHADKVVLLVDDSKFLQRGGLTSLSFAEIDVVVCNQRPQAGLEEHLYDNDCELVLLQN